MSNQQDIFYRDNAENLCEIAYMVATSGFNPSHINEIDSDYEYTVEEAFEFYEWIYESLKDYNRSFLDELHSLKLDDYKKLAEKFIAWENDNNPYS